MRLKKAVSELADTLAEIEFEINRSDNDIVDNKKDLDFLLSKFDKMTHEIEDEKPSTIITKGWQTIGYTELNEVHIMLQEVHEHLDIAIRVLKSATDKVYDAEDDLGGFGGEEI